MALEAIVDARLGILTAFEVWTKTNPQARLEDSLRSIYGRIQRRRG